MSNVVEPLRKLQDMDATIHQLRKQIEEIPRELEAAKSALIEKESEHAAQLEKIKQMKVELSTKELDLQKFTDRAEDLSQKQLSASNNKEFAAFAAEIASAKADRSRVEDAILKDLEQIDTETEVAEGLQGEVAEEKGRLDGEQSSILQEVEQMKVDLDQLTGQRDSVTADVEADVLTMYERILRSKKDGKALAEASATNCLGCGAGLNPQNLNLLLLGKELVICRSCSRILFLPDPESVLKK
jgi:predicted  nucleic acid-binding Zn-ribbon protein